VKTCTRCGYSPSEKQRSNPQNRYYWGCVVQVISDELGYTRTEVHEMLKQKFLTSMECIKNKRTGISYLIPKEKSTTSLDTKSWEEFMSQVREWASMALNIYIPEPNEDATTEVN
jgi:hypothetical protein